MPAATPSFAMGCPLDAVLLDVRHSWPGKLEVLVASESFEEAPHGSAGELLSPEIRILRGLA
jgi:hypothetical protein